MRKIVAIILVGCLLLTSMGMIGAGAVQSTSMQQNQTIKADRSDNSVDITS